MELENILNNFLEGKEVVEIENDKKEDIQNFNSLDDSKKSKYSHASLLLEPASDIKQDTVENIFISHVIDSIEDMVKNEEGENSALYRLLAGEKDYDIEAAMREGKMGGKNNNSKSKKNRKSNKHKTKKRKGKKSNSRKIKFA